MTYSHLLGDDGLQPAYVDALGQRWSSATPSEVHPDMPHSCQVDEQLRLLKFELHDTELDKSADGRRRSELSLTELPGQLAYNGQRIWNSYLFRIAPFTDPEGMMTAMGSTALSISQLKPNSGGSPTRAHRLTGDARFRATRTYPAKDNYKQYTSPLGIRYDDGNPHRIVETLIPHPTAGEWQLWLDGIRVVNIKGVPIGANTTGYSISYGIYSGALEGDLLIEYANPIHNSATSLEHLIDDYTWPVAVCPTCGQAMNV
jgi:hypothetical protein